MKDQIEHSKELNEDLKTLTEKKIRLEEQFNSKKKDLTDLVQEIKEAGYDPRKLGEIIKGKEEDLQKSIGTFEKDLQKVSEQLTEIEGA